MLSTGCLREPLHLFFHPGYLGVGGWHYRTATPEICLTLRGFWLPRTLPASVGGEEAVGPLLFVWERARAVAKAGVGPGVPLWEPEREGQRETTLSCDTLTCHSLSLCVYSSLLPPLCLLPPPSEPWPWHRGWAAWFCPSASSGVEFLGSASQAARGGSLALPFPLALKPVRPVCRGPVPDCVFLTPLARPL